MLMKPSLRGIICSALSAVHYVARLMLCLNVALQALVTLQWLVAYDCTADPPSDTDQSDPEPDLSTPILPRPLLEAPELQLAKALWKMLHQLLIHQLQDLSQDMQQIPSTILLCAALSLAQPGLQDFKPFTDLVSATLRRITQDEAQYKPDPVTGLGVDELDQEGSHRFTVFWFFLGKSCQEDVQPACCLPQVASESNSLRSGTVQSDLAGASFNVSAQSACLMCVGVRV